MAAKNGLNALKQIIKLSTSEVTNFENVLNKVSLLFFEVLQIYSRSKIITLIHVDGSLERGSTCA